jgi:hypothetical protein
MGAFIVHRKSMMGERAEKGWSKSKSINMNSTKITFKTILPISIIKIISQHSKRETSVMGKVHQEWWLDMESLMNKKRDHRIIHMKPVKISLAATTTLSKT